MHSFYLHRYGTHGQFSMTRGWERFFFIMTWILQGPSFLNPKAYAILHLEHHAHSDTPNDPHSPLNFSKKKFGIDFAVAVPKMMLWTSKIYGEVKRGTSALVLLYRERRFITWGEFEKFASGTNSMLITGAFYIALYIVFAPVWWCWVFLPITLMNGAVQGAIVNWCGHMWGYRNFKLNDNSKNTWILSTVMLGELFQNNHHQYPDSPNFGKRWFELDPIYIAIWTFNKLGIIKIRSDVL